MNFGSDIMEPIITNCILRNNINSYTMKTKLLLLSAFAFAIKANAQSISPQVFSTTGDYYTASTSSLSWTMGEPLIDTYSNSQSMLTQGFQQPSFSLTTDIIDASELKLDIEVFPNPFNYFLTIKTKDATQEISSIVLIDVSGKEITTSFIRKSTGIFEVNTSEFRHHADFGCAEER